MSASSVDVRKLTMYAIKKGDNEIILNEEELAMLLARPEAQAVLKKIAAREAQAEVVDAGAAGYTLKPEEQGVTVAKKRTARIPNGYKFVFESSTDAKSAFNSKFKYYRHDVRQDWGYVTVKEEGDESCFGRIGRVGFVNSAMHTYLSRMPADGQYYVKKDLSQFTKILDGRKIKAILDVLEYEKYIEAKPLVSKGGRKGYRKINGNKVEPAELVSHEHAEAHISAGSSFDSKRKGG